DLGVPLLLKEVVGAGAAAGGQVVDRDRPGGRVNEAAVDRVADRVVALGQTGEGVGAVGVGRGGRGRGGRAASQAHRHARLAGLAAVIDAVAVEVVVDVAADLGVPLLLEEVVGAGAAAGGQVVDGDRPGARVNEAAVDRVADRVVALGQTGEGVGAVGVVRGGRGRGGRAASQAHRHAGLAGLAAVIDAVAVEVVVDVAADLGVPLLLKEVVGAGAAAGGQVVDRDRPGARVNEAAVDRVADRVVALGQTGEGVGAVGVGRGGRGRGGRAASQAHRHAGLAGLAAVIDAVAVEVVVDVAAD